MTPIDAAAPERAPRRADLTFLRRRARPVSRPNPAIAAFVAGRSSAHASTPHSTATASSGAPARAGTRAGASLDLNDPAPPTAPPQSAAGSLLDLSAPAAATPPRAGPQSQQHPSSPADTGASTSLDLGAVPIRIAQAQPVPASPTTSLDLSPARPPSTTATRPPATAITTPTTATAGAAAGYRLPAGLRPAAGRPEPRTQQGVPTVLGPQNPTVTLTRLQSGVGTLSIEAAVTAAVGDLRLGAAYQLRSGRSSTVQHHAGRRFAPPNESRRPLVVASRQQFERLAVDLRQVFDLERLVVFAFSGNGGQLHWGGTLLVSTFAGDRIEMPIELPPTAAVAVLASVYNVRGELVVRSEMDLIGHSIQEACRGYGFDRITWLDEITPID